MRRRVRDEKKKKQKREKVFRVTKRGSVNKISSLSNMSIHLFPSLLRSVRIVSFMYKRVLTISFKLAQEPQNRPPLILCGTTFHFISVFSRQHLTQLGWVQDSSDVGSEATLKRTHAHFFTLFFAFSFTLYGCPCSFKVIIGSIDEKKHTLVFCSLSAHERARDLTWPLAVPFPPPHSLRATHDGIGEQQREKEERKGEKESCQILVMKTLFKKR
jgi:hypothetical protein